MKVMVGVPTTDYTRHALFYDYLDNLRKPEGTLIARAHGSSAAWNRNLIIGEALQEDCSHIFFLDDDMAFAPDSLMKLIEHDKDIVSGLYLNRVWPHSPVIYDAVRDDGVCRIYFPKSYDQGLIEIVACGFGIVLVKIEVFKLMDKPWVRLGELNPDKRNEDIGFCHRARKIGYKLHCDLSVLAGHMATAVVWPNHYNGNWNITYDTNGSQVVTVPRSEVDSQDSKTDISGLVLAE